MGCMFSGCAGKSRSGQCLSPQCRLWSLLWQGNAGFFWRHPEVRRARSRLGMGAEGCSSSECLSGLIGGGVVVGSSLSLKMAQALFSGSRASRDIPHMLLRILMLGFCLGVSSGGSLPVPWGVLDVLLCHPVRAKP